MSLAGLPLLVADTAELKRFVTEAGNGLAVNAASVEQVALGLSEVYARRTALRPDPSHLAALKSRFAWAPQGERLIDLYDAVTAAPSGMPAAMARRALATVPRPERLAASGG